MTIPNQPPQTDPRRPSVPTSSLPLVGPPYGQHRRIGNLNSPYQQKSSYRTSYQASSSPVSDSNISSTGGNNSSTYSSLMVRASVEGGLASVNSGHSGNLAVLSPPANNALKNINHAQHPYDQRAELQHPNPGSIQSESEHSPSSPNSSYRPLNVIDALAYLDQVKGRFTDKPNVYNQFLDIMKDFKSQSIDTPGVIKRVSTLFKGHPLLISGFNTFLPAGYRIDCSIDPRDPNRILVTTPNGNTTTSTTSTAEDIQNLDLGHNYHNLAQQRQTGHYHPSHPYLPPLPLGSMHPPHHSLPPPSSRHSTSSSSQHASPYNMTNSGKSFHNTPVTTFIPPQSSPVPPTSQALERRPPVEFNHAINYVNRIKNRYAHSPHIYKQFLEILQTYQKEQKPIEEVYTHVQFLFNGADDLLNEFKQFLPEISQQQQPLSSSPNQPSRHGNGFKRYTSINSNPSSSSTKKKKTNVTRKPKLDNDNLGNENGAIVYQQEEKSLLFTCTFDPQCPNVSIEEMELFEKIKKYVGNKPSFEEFLKTLNLYTQQIIDMDQLIVQVKPFFGTNKELLDTFKIAIGFDPKEHPIVKPAISAPKPDLNHCTAIKSSPSYRIVPKDWQNQPCSGRDQMCWELLNDKYVSYPIWASEDSGFVASKKNSYEEALHRCEEERYEYDLNIEANLNTIALLRPIALKIEKMAPEEQKNMRLQPGLGGSSVSIYERIIKKVYDDERGDEIIEMLYERPATVVPVLLNRLQIKDKEWKKAQREWNKVWRDLDDKNFYRSLDYQGNTFKANDKKAMTPKAFITEIETILLKRPTVVPQYTFEFTDLAVFDGIFRLVVSFMDRQNGFTKSDTQKVKQFMSAFVPMFFYMSQDRSPSSEKSIEGNLKGHEDYHTKESHTKILSIQKNSPNHPSASLEDGTSSHTTNKDRTQSVLQKKGTPIPDKLNVNPETKTIGVNMVVEDFVVDNIVVPDDGQINAEEGMELFAAAAAATAPNHNIIATQTRNYSFLCNSHYYCLFRIYQVLYERLLKMKIFSDHVKTNPTLGKQFNKTAVELDLISNRFDDIDLSNGYYNALLNLIDQFFEGEMESSSFEENIRYIFGINAYNMFSVDKVVQVLIKQIQLVAADKKSIELVKLFQRDQEAHGNIPPYRSSVEQVLGIDENLYKISFDCDQQITSIQLLDKESESPSEVAEQELYNKYMANYIDWMHDTKGIDKSLLNPSFLNRNLKSQDKHLEEINVRSRLRYKIQRKSYHMYYIVGSEDALYRPSIIQYNQDMNINTLKAWLSKQGNDHLDEDTRNLLN